MIAIDCTNIVDIPAPNSIGRINTCVPSRNSANTDPPIMLIAPIKKVPYYKILNKLSTDQCLPISVYISVSNYQRLLISVYLSVNPSVHFTHYLAQTICHWLHGERNTETNCKLDKWHECNIFFSKSLSADINCFPREYNIDNRIK